MLTCKRCGHTWTPRTSEPSACPACKSYQWKEEKKTSTAVVEKTKGEKQ